MPSRGIMNISSSVKSLLRKYSHSLFYSNDEYPLHDRIYAFYLLIRPMLEWIVPELTFLGITSEEIESELYILIADIYQKFDSSRSSIVPYVEKAIPWHVSKLINKARKANSPLLVNIDEIDRTYIDEEFYLKSPDIIFTNRYIGKYLTRSEKYFINMILSSDKNDISNRKFAKALGIERKQVQQLCSGIRKQWRKSYD
jgi:hypothetical protein